MPFQKWQNDQGGEVVKPAAGISLAYRGAIYLFVILPKLLLTIAVLVYGTNYVMLATDTNGLIFNSMAATFILSLDDIIYGALTSPLHQTWLATSSEITFDDDEEDSLNHYHAYVALFGIAGTTYAMWTYTC